MYPNLDRLVCDLGISQGELLQLAREIAQNDSLRTIDRLTARERIELEAVLASWYCVTADECAVA